MDANRSIDSTSISMDPGWTFGMAPKLVGVDDIDLLRSNILIFDSTEGNGQIFTELSQAGFLNITRCCDAHELCKQVNSRQLDLMVVDTEDLANAEVCDTIAILSEETKLPVLIQYSKDNSDRKQLAMELGATDFISKPIDTFELISRTRNILQSRLVAKQLAEHSRRLQTDILIDPLTGVSNRRAFEFELTRKMIEWQRQRSPIALLMIDIDYFKNINDGYGHQAGDCVLTQVAMEIKELLREMDLVCRYGGEEFAAIVPIKRQHESTLTAERIREKIENTVFRFESFEIQVSVSIGVAEAMKGDDQELIVKRADTALYESKRNGRNRVTFHNGAKCIEGFCPDGDQRVKRNVGNMLSWAVNDDVFNLCSSNILIVDDSRVTTKVVRSYLDKGGFRNLFCETEPRSVMSYLDCTPPDLILLDVEMPDLDGLTLLGQLRSDGRSKNVPIIILTAHTDQATKNSALELGANDVLHKPVIVSELIARVTNILLANAHTQFLANYSNKLEQEVKLRTAELIASRREAIQCLARVAELRDDDSGRHVIRVGKYAALIACELGFTESQVVELEHAAQLHDIGKIYVPGSILEKQDGLTVDEFDIVKSHCDDGRKIIRDDNDESEATDLFLLDSCNSNVMRMAALVAESHHEKWDGTGYPCGLKGGNIPIEARIVAICDVFDAVSNPKTYRNAYNLEDCFQIIADGAGSHFDPEIVDTFFRRKDEVVQVYRDFGDFEIVDVG